MSDPVPSEVRKLVSSHGYAFQYAVMRRAQELLEHSSASEWIFEAAEFPVGDSQNIIHIDFILKARNTNVYLIAECKRVDPARSRWCFVKAPYTRRDSYQDELVFQEITSRQIDIGVTPGTQYATVSKALTITARTAATSHLGVELRSVAKGDGSFTRGAINDATTQVLRGMNGLVDTLFGRAVTGNDIGRNILVPVIFTTASLWIAQGDLSSADLTTGELPANWGEVTRVPWLWFNYNQSRALRHKLPVSEALGAGEISKLLHEEYTRTIAVVSPGGLDTFLQENLADRLRLY